MSTGDSIKAGEITTAYNTTDLVAEPKWDNYHRTEFAGTVIFRVGPSNNYKDNEVPEATLDGLQSLGLYGERDHRARGSNRRYARDRRRRARHWRAPMTDADVPPDTGGIGVKGIAGGVADGVVGTSDAHFRSGVFGFNSVSSGIRQSPPMACLAVATPSAERASARSRPWRWRERPCGGNDAVFGLSDAPNKSGVSGFNSREEGVGYGVFGRCDANGAQGRRESALGVGVRGHSRFSDGAVGMSDAHARNGATASIPIPRRRLWRVRPLDPPARHRIGATAIAPRRQFGGGLAPLRIARRDRCLRESATGIDSKA